VFSGRHEHAIDGKGRTSLPSRFREVLAGTGDSRVVLTTGFERCVVAYPLQGWQAFEQKVAQMPEFDEAVIALRFLYMSSAIEVEIDKLGRLLVPQVLRDHGDLRRDVVWAGVGNHIQLWDKGRYAATRDALLADPDKRKALMKRLAELGL
jgi:MraZ protein